MAVGCLFLYLVGASGYDLLTDDEIRYAEAGRQMLATGDWILPEYNGYPRYQKPILFYWLQALSQAIFGSTFLATRLPCALAGTGVVLLTAQLGRVLWGRTAGLWSGVVLALSVEMVLLSRMVMTDVVLLLFLQGACNCFCFVQLSSDLGKQRRWLRGMYVCLAFGVLTKGPIALVLPLAIVFPWLCVRRELWSTFWRMRPWEGLAIILAVAGPWYYWVDWHTHGQFTRHFFLDENLGRFTAVINEHHQPAFFYWLLLIPMTFPWTGELVSAIRWSCQARLRQVSFREAAPWLFLWQIAVVLLLFSLSKTRVWTYILPLFPAVAMLVGRWMARPSAEIERSAVVRVFSWAFAGLALIMASAATLWPFERMPLELRAENVIASLQTCLWLLFVLSAVLLAVLRRSSMMHARIALAAGVAIWYLCIVTTFLPAYDRHWKQPVRDVAAAMRQYPHAKAVIYRVHELGLNFHSGCPIVRQWREGCRESLDDLLSCREPVFVLCPAQNLSDLDGLRFHKWGENSRFVWGANIPEITPEGESSSLRGLPWN